ncbi:VCBS repeat-containing protein [Maribacter hydrothermalis]|uniref:RNA-binding protein n=1 Tax=Maribacter hydrothermalis TaxID=1836467 RepID=A0A1B7ZFT3_9FLAO|nr:VCBS repeat-containing protein [Maribacter hydrothermalis]APQ19305.1 RNA-binding protein [Maribacter hydrothermalis]OBR42401.1 RNA-binding protein [Maribacter hydrothermalis]
MRKKLFPFVFIVFLLMQSCNNKAKNLNAENATSSIENTPLFTLLSETETNISFQNTLKEGLNANVLVYEYLYNGGGVATGDFNNDGLQDLYFTSNMGVNKFYLNEGDFKFKDITQLAKVEGRSGPWKTGITSADVNGDGKLDLYLCYSGALPDAKRKNQLFINQGNDENNVPIFKEQAEKYGLASAAFSNQGYFFDYDRDGDLDMLLLNHNPKSLPVLNEVSTKEFLKKDDPLQGIRLFEQKENVFNDVTIKSGLSGSALTYGLGIGISDINNDGWQDFYVSNDYTIPDYLYINNKNGTFTDQLGSQMGHTSHFSMGNNVADINNDGLQDIFTLDMLPKDNKRQKLLLSPDNYEKFDLNLRSGFHHQYMRNMMQLNNGDDTFSEIGQIAGISNTDWSWAPLFADFDNDGFKDLYITNGYFRDYTNLDFINYMENFVQTKGRLQRQDVLELIKKMPASNLTNFFYTNKDGINFTDATNSSGTNQPANSNGAIYTDLDNDGDLDLVVNNINKPAFIYRNDSNNQDYNYLSIELKGDSRNTHGIGSKVSVFTNGQIQVLEQMPTQGYLSTVSTILHFGLAKNATIDSLVVNWNSGKTETLKQVSANQLLVLGEENAKYSTSIKNKPDVLFSKLESGLNYQHQSSSINDFKRQSLLLKQLSHDGPPMAKGDINNDGLEDIVIGGGIGQVTSIFIQTNNKKFTQKVNASFDVDKESYDSDIALFDVNNDGNLDMYVASGGYHNFAQNDPLLQDRLYLGDGKGSFIKSESALPSIPTNTGSVAFSDVNDDTFLDIFVGGSITPGRFPESSSSYILINDGKGNFTDKTNAIQPELKNLGITTDATWVDLDGDKKEDLIVVGEWMPILIYLNKNGKLIEKTNQFLEEPLSGLWTGLHVTDLNSDGKPDIVAGNIGSNTQFKLSTDAPAELYYADFDENGSLDPILNFYVEDKSYPYLTRDELLGQLSGLRRRFTSYEKYANATLKDIFSEAELQKATKLTVTHQETTVLISTASSKYQNIPLPVQAQYSPISEILSSDLNNDGIVDLLLLGNNDFYKLRIGKFDANYGTVLLGVGDGTFRHVSQPKSGLSIKGSNTNAVMINNELIITSYGAPTKTYKLLK